MLMFNLCLFNMVFIKIFFCYKIEVEKLIKINLNCLPYWVSYKSVGN